MPEEELLLEENEPSLEELPEEETDDERIQRLLDETDPETATEPE